MLSTALTLGSIITAVLVFHHQSIKQRQYALLTDIVQRITLMNDIAITPDGAANYARFSAHKRIVIASAQKFFDCHTWWRWRKNHIKKRNAILGDITSWVEYIEINTPIEQSVRIHLSPTVISPALSQKTINTLYTKSSEIINQLYQLY